MNTPKQDAKDSQMSFDALRDNFGMLMGKPKNDIHDERILDIDISAAYKRREPPIKYEPKYDESKVVVVAAQTEASELNEKIIEWVMREQERHLSEMVAPMFETDPAHFRLIKNPTEHK